MLHNFVRLHKCFACTGLTPGAGEFAESGKVLQVEAMACRGATKWLQDKGLVGAVIEIDSAGVVHAVKCGN